MNIDDVEIEDTELTIDSVFAKQHELMKTYGVIEGRHNPVNLDTREGQQVVKDFLWRITEEVGEALDSNLGPAHIKEELADALHFLVELCIFTEREGVAKTIFEEEKLLNIRRASMQQLWISLAGVGRTCKNKPWKQTQIPMDQTSFTAALRMLIYDYIGYSMYVFENLTEMYFYYHKKAKVNEFRQRSKY